MDRLQPDELDRVFPFHIVVGPDLRIQRLGRSLRKVMPELVPGSDLVAAFAMERPHAPLTYAVMSERGQTSCVLTARARALELKGQVIVREAPACLLFLGAPRLTSPSDMARLGVTLEDFAVHDAVIDFLVLSHAQETALAEVQAMADRLTDQRKQVREAHHRITTLYVASRVLAESPTLEVALQALVPALGTTLGCSTASAWRRQGDQLVCVSSLPDRGPVAAVRLGQSRGMIAGVFAAGEPMWLPAGYGPGDGVLAPPATRPTDDLDPPTLRYGGAPVPTADAVCGFPVRSDGEVIGVIALARPTTIQRSDDLLYLLGEIASKVEQFTAQRVAAAALASRAAELAEARDAALASVRAKTEFLANVSHELRTPLGAVIGMASVLRGMQLGGAADAVVDDIETAGQTLLRLVDDLLDESRIAAGKVSIDPAPFDVAELVRSTATTHEIAATRRGIGLHVEIPPGTRGDVIGDRVRIGQVLTNLLGNALKFTERGAVRVRLTCVDDTRDSALVTLAVTDTGIGIEASQLERVFEPFTQADGSTTRRFGGAGLGLTICRRLIAMMGGSIEVTSRPGAGSTFTVRLRLDRPAQPVRLARTAPLPKLSARRRVLVVEDNELGQRATRMMLEQLGHEVVVATDGATAVALVAASTFELVLMDCHLPVLDGFEATLRIRALDGPCGHVPIVACTASVLPEERERCFEVGMDDVVLKPLSPSELHRVITETSAAPAPSTPARAPLRPTTDEILDPARLALLRSLIDTRGRPALAPLIALYQEHAPAHLAGIDAAAAAGDAEALRRAAHALRGMSANVGATAVAQACAVLERAAVADTRARLDELHGAYAATLTALVHLDADPPAR